MYERCLNEAERILASDKDVIVPVKKIWEAVDKQRKKQGFEIPSLPDFTALLEGDARFEFMPSLDENGDPMDGKQRGTSGVGNEEGDKGTRLAEQLAAMGKISEIIGKRSANITGEAMVEVQSTSQQLRTPYAPRGARHSQGGAEIGRDEIPVALQTFVERYFEQVR